MSMLPALRLQLLMWPQLVMLLRASLPQLMMLRESLLRLMLLRNMRLQ